MASVLLINGSPRVNGNSSIAAQWVVEGMRSQGSVFFERIETGQIINQMNGCAECYSCQAWGGFKCTIGDETAGIVNRLSECDWVIFATPIFFFNVSGQLKILFDRLLALTSQKPDGTVSTPLAGKNWAFVITSGGDEAASGATLVREWIIRVTRYLRLGRVEIFYRGGCPNDAAQLAGDETLKREALQFGASLYAPNRMLTGGSPRALN